LIDDRTYIVLGIDFCHLGPRYGDPFAVNEGHIKKALETDKQLIEITFNESPEEFINKTKNLAPMKICGLSCLYLLNLILNKAELDGEYKIYYQEALPFGQGSVVSVASAGYYC